jgi:TetR/AcrR family transcriptional regulator, lmrAB and yxaGH operons repressor
MLLSDSTFDDGRHRSQTLAEAMTVVLEMPYPAPMAAKNETKDPAADRRRSPARARMVRSAATLIRERGIHGTGLREVVAHSGGPRGSLGRFFPGGKTQLVTEAIDVALVDLFGDLEDALGEAETFSEAIGVIVSPWRRLLVDHDFDLGCPLAATICDAADNDSLRSHVREWFASWRAPVADAYIKFGAPPAEAEAHATVLMGALEGALIIARAQRSIEPLDSVERFFASRAPDARRA